MGALSINGIPALRAPFEPLVPEVLHVRNTNRYHRPPDETEEEFTALLLDDLEHTIEAAGPETVAMVIMEPVQNAGGAFTRPCGLLARRARALRPLRHPPLRRRGDHGLRPARRVVRLGALRHPTGPDHDREGPVVVLRVDRRRRRDRPRVEPFMQDTNMYSHGITFGGHPVQAAVALKNIEIMKRDRIVEHVAETQDDVPRDARAAPRPADRRRRAWDRVLLRGGARQGQGDARELRRRGVRDAAARLPLAASCSSAA